MNFVRLALAALSVMLTVQPARGQTVVLRDVEKRLLTEKLDEFETEALEPMALPFATSACASWIAANATCGDDAGRRWSARGGQRFVNDLSLAAV